MKCYNRKKSGRAALGLFNVDGWNWTVKTFSFSLSHWFDMLCDNTKYLQINLSHVKYLLFPLTLFLFVRSPLLWCLLPYIIMTMCKQFQQFMSIFYCLHHLSMSLNVRNIKNETFGALENVIVFGGVMSRQHIWLNRNSIYSMQEVSLTSRQSDDDACEVCHTPHIEYIRYSLKSFLILF